jgi:hypothetical protein
MEIPTIVLIFFLVLAVLGILAVLFLGTVRVQVQEIPLTPAPPLPTDVPAGILRDQSGDGTPNGPDVFAGSLP